MALFLIIGPMKSGKSLDLISRFAPLKYTDFSFGLYQSAKNSREKDIRSRNGARIEAKKVESLFEILNQDLKMVGIDEIHMFPAKEAEVIEKLLKRGVGVVASGLDNDYRGEMFEMVKKLFELGPEEVKYKKAVCELCKSQDAVYTQIVRNGKPVLGGLPSVIPEDGTYLYRPVCRNCFVRAS